jgi:hypothetical protein
MDYSIALFLHLFSLVLAVVGASLTTFALFRLRMAETAGEVARWLALSRRGARLFPVATIGLLATGGYMAHSIAAWPQAWVVAPPIGLMAIVVLGVGIEASRLRTLGRELQSAGLSARARQLLRDPLAWSAKMTAHSLLVAIMAIMTVKPSGEACALILAAAVVAGVAVAVPFWTAPKLATADAAATR